MLLVINNRNNPIIIAPINSNTIVKPINPIMVTLYNFW